MAAPSRRRSFTRSRRFPAPYPIRASRGAWSRRRLAAALDGVPDVEQDLEVELFAPIGEIERGHLPLVGSRFGAVERLAVHLVQVGQNTVARSGHTSGLGSS